MALISKVDRHISDKVLYATLLCSVNRRFIQYWRAFHVDMKTASLSDGNENSKKPISLD